MQVVASHQAERPSPTGAEAFEAMMGKIVALSIVKKAAPVVDRDLSAGSAGELMAQWTPDLASSLLEELQQARFREARRRKRVETLEHEIRVARAQNEALRGALQTARSAVGVTLVAREAEVSRPDPFSARRTAEIARSRKFSRSLVRLFRERP